MKMATPLATDMVRPNERLVAIGKEPHARRRHGKLVQWFVTDKYCQILLSSGKLSSLQTYINAHLVEERHDRVNMSGMYESMGRSDARTGGYYQHRWKVSCTPIEDATHVFEKLRPGFETAVLVGTQGSYVKEGP